MQPHTDKSTVLALAIRDLIILNKESLGLEDTDFIGYGDHNSVTGAKAVTVMSGTKRRSLAGVAGPGGRSKNELEVIIQIFYAKLENEEAARLAVDQLSEQTESLLHQDTTMGGIIIHGFVQNWIPGVIYRESSMYRVVQLIYVGQTKTNITP